MKSRTAPGVAKGRDHSQQRPRQQEPQEATLPRQAANRRRDALAGAFLLSLLLVVYWPALRGRLIWDDAAHVTRPALQSLHGLWRIWSDLTATQQYYPLLHSAFWLEHRLWGDSVFAYHLLNLILHAVAACLLVAIVRRLKLPGAWLAAFVFALHPVATETVAWISEQKNTLSAVFYLAAALFYLRFDETRRRSHYFGAFGFFVLALLTKTVTATLPAALLVVFWWKRGQIQWVRDVRPLAPWLAIGAAAGYLTSWVERHYIGAQGADFSLTAIERCLIAGRVVWFYFGKLVWPWPLIFVYPRWNISASLWWQYAFPLSATALAAALVVVARRARGPIAAFLVYTGTLFPALGFLNVYPFVFSYVADHFQYLAMLGVIVPCCAFVTSAVRRLPGTARKCASLAAVALLGIYGGLAWAHGRAFRNSEALYRSTLAQNPDAWMAHLNLGVILHDRPGRLNEAIAEYREALRLRPDYPEAHTNLGNAFVELPDRLQDAVAEFREALRLRPKSVEAYVGLGDVARKTPNGLAEAITEYQRALRIRPDCAEARAGLGNALLTQAGATQAAITEFREALRIRPDYAEGRVGLGNAYAMLPNRLQDAVAEYREALRIRPDYPLAHNNLGNVLLMMPNRLDGALAEYREAVRLQPDYAEAYNGLGNALSMIQGKQAEAIAAYREALRLRPDYAKAHFNFGTLLSGIPGRSSEAIAEFEAALRYSPDFDLAREALGRLRTR